MQCCMHAAQHYDGALSYSGVLSPVHQWSASRTVRLLFDIHSGWGVDDQVYADMLQYTILPPTHPIEVHNMRHLPIYRINRTTPLLKTFEDDFSGMTGVPM